MIVGFLWFWSNLFPCLRCSVYCATTQLWSDTWGVKSQRILELWGMFSPYVFPSIKKKSPIIMRIIHTLLCRWRHTVFLIESYVCFAQKFGEGDRDRGRPLTIWIYFRMWLMMFGCKFPPEEYNRMILRLLLLTIILTINKNADSQWMLPLIII